MATTPKQKFDAAVKVIHSLPKDGPFQPSYEMMLNFYAYYKQATEGVCKKAKPWAWDIVNKKKWDAWTKLGDLPREEAMLKYVEELKKTIKNYTELGKELKEKGDPRIVEAMPQSDDVREFMEKLGSFYEIVDEESPVHAAAKEHATEEQANMITGGKDITALDDNSDEKSNHSVMVESVFNRNGDEFGLTNGEFDQEEERIEDDINHIEQEQNESNSRTTSPGDVETTDEVKLIADGGQLPAVDTESEEEFCDTSDQPSQDNSGDEIDADVLSNSTPLKSTPHKGVNHVVVDSMSRVKHVTDLQSMSPITKPIITQKGNESVSNNISFRNLDSRNEIGDSLLVHGPGEATLNLYNESGITERNLGDMDNESSENLNISSLNNNHASKYGGGDMSPPGGSSGRQGQRSFGGTNSSMEGRGSSYATNQQTGGMSSQQTGSVNEHILVAIDRLHQDMNNVQSRLNALEVKQKSMQERREDNSSWAGILRSLPRGKSLFFIFVWPLIIHWILLKIFHRRRNRPS